MTRTDARTLEHSVLLTIDVQNDFAQPGPAYVSETNERLPAISRLAAAFRQQRKPIVHVVRFYERDGSNAEPFRARSIREKGPVVAPGSQGAKLAAGVGPGDDYTLDTELLYAGNLQQIGLKEWVLYKPRWDAFYATRLEEHLRSLGVKTVVVCGCNLPNCPRATLFGASARDFNTVLVSDATSQTTAERLADLRLIGTEVCNVEQVLALCGLGNPA